MGEAALDAPRGRVEGARRAVIVLTAINLLNYLDRYVPSAVKDLFKADLHLTDAQTSWPLTAFIVVYMLASPIFGTLADRTARRLLIAAGILAWSLATGAAAFAVGFWTFLVARALVGVGEAAYATIAPALIGDLYPPERRNRILTVFYLAIPIGSALGFALGGVFGRAFGWRAAFLLCAAPGAVAALVALRIPEPDRGHFDRPAVKDGEPASCAAEPIPDWPEALGALAHNPTWLLAVAGYTAVTFASGGLADWIPTWLSRVHGADVATAGTAVGGVTVVAGLGGTLTGGLVADKLRGRTRMPYLALSAGSMVPAALLAVLAFVVPSLLGAIACIGLAQFFMWFYNGPINTVLVNSVPANMRARAFSLSILSIHLFGDAISPPILGAVSDATGNLTLALGLAPLMLGVAALAWGAGSWRAPG